MNGIIGMTQLTLDTNLMQYQREMLSIVQNLANSLLTIIDDILDLSKIEANRMVIEEIPYTLRGTVFNTLKTLAVKANEKSLDLTYRVDSSVPYHIVGDPFRLRQIILNLLGNAIKFTERGVVSLTIRTIVQDHCPPTDTPSSFRYPTQVLAFNLISSILYSILSNRLMARRPESLAVLVLDFPFRRNW